MNDPAIPAAPSPPPPRPTGESAKPSERVRLFTPIDGDPLRRPKGLRRLPPLSAHSEEIENPAAQLGRDGDDHELDHSAAARPTLVPNAAIPYLQRVHASSNPEKLERRFSAAVRTLAWGALGTAVAVAVTSSFLFRVKSDAPSATATAAHPGQASPAPPAMTAAETADATRDALAALDGFLLATTADARRASVETTETLPPTLTGNGPIPGLIEAEVARHDARLFHAGALKVVLVPVTDLTGLPRTAAVLHRGDGWRVDWRSLITPETMAWQKIVEGGTPGAGLFRVLLAREVDGGWTVARHATDDRRLTASISPGSRVGAELDEALANRHGAPMVADVFLESGADRRLNIVDWTKDKWSL